jgi:hypothetical protein
MRPSPGPYSPGHDLLSSIADDQAAVPISVVLPLLGALSRAFLSACWPVIHNSKLSGAREVEGWSAVFTAGADGLLRQAIG